jgi:hypothetical protein
MGLRDLRNQVSNINESVSSITSVNFEFLFSILFALLVILFHETNSFLRFLTGLILLPFTLLHEFGHYISAILFLPSCDPQIYTYLGDNGVNYAQLTTNGLPIGFKSILVMFAGSFTLLICSLGLIFLFRKGTSHSHTVFRNFLLFGLLSDIPNLFPILPTVLGAPSDGYLTWIYLHVLISLPFPTAEFSIIWSSIASILIIASYYCLGSSIYHLITYLRPTVYLQPQKPTESVN